MMAFNDIMGGALGDHALPCAHGGNNVYGCYQTFIAPQNVMNDDRR